MNRLLIVDDEPIIVNGLVDFFTQQEQWPLEVYGALSAEEALAQLSRHRMDIVITDIGMPDMNGLEMQKRIVRQWPRCKVIFLTGYNDFGYVQEAMRHQGFDYVLKAEGDEAILKALGKAIEHTREEIRKEEMLERAEQQMRLAVPSLQKELLRQILLGDKQAIGSLSEHFVKLQLPFQADQPVIMVLARVDAFKAEYSLYDRSLLMYSIQNIAQEYLQKSVRMVSVELDRSRMLWFIQPQLEEGTDSDCWENCGKFIKGSLELVQQACNDLLRTPISFIMQDEPVAWPKVSYVFEHYTRMMSRGLGMGNEFLWTFQGEEEKTSEFARTPFNSISLHNRLDQLKLHLQNIQKESFDSVMQEIMQEGARHDDNPMIQQEIYYSLVSLFLSHLNRHDAGVSGLHKDIGKLTKMGIHSSWLDVTEFFEQFSAAIFAESKGGMEQEENVVVHKIQTYIQKHLNEDISLIRIGDVIGYNSKYLSRLYKKITGEDLSAYISRTKLSRAQRMLKETDMKIYEVSGAVGFLSEPYFYRFFRKATGMTPQEYRDLNGR